MMLFTEFRNFVGPDDFYHSVFRGRPNGITDKFYGHLCEINGFQINDGIAAVGKILKSN